MINIAENKAKRAGSPRSAMNHDVESSPECPVIGKAGKAVCGGHPLDLLMGPIVWAINFHYAYCLAGTRFQAHSIGASTYFAP